MKIEFTDLSDQEKQLVFSLEKECPECSVMEVVAGFDGQTPLVAYVPNLIQALGTVIAAVINVVGKNWGQPQSEPKIEINVDSEEDADATLVRELERYARRYIDFAVSKNKLNRVESQRNPTVKVSTNRYSIYVSGSEIKIDIKDALDPELVKEIKEHIYYHTGKGNR